MLELIRKERTMFSIGEFSKITGLTIKTLRFYHDEGLLSPTMVDPQSGYRYYDHAKIETARVIAYLRELELPLAEIKQILASSQDESEILSVMEKQKVSLEQRIRRYRHIARSLQQFIDTERQAQVMSTQSEFAVEEKTLEPMLIAGIRMKGRYDECGKGFAKIGRSLGRFICGKAMLLHYDTEYKENDADFEAAMPIRQRKDVDGISIRELPGGRCLALVHKGPYDQLGRSYARILDYIKQKGYTVLAPSREVYIKGPGMIFKGNPNKYLTEIQMMIA